MDSARGLKLGAQSWALSPLRCPLLTGNPCQSVQSHLNMPGAPPVQTPSPGMLGGAEPGVYALKTHRQAAASCLLQGESLGLQAHPQADALGSPHQRAWRPAVRHLGRGFSGAAFRAAPVARDSSFQMCPFIGVSSSLSHCLLPGASLQANSPYLGPCVRLRG